MIRLQGITKKYGSLKALDNLDLTVPAGKVMVFLGPNGAGKTTTLKICTGLVRPDAGEVEICGLRLHPDPVPARRLMGYVPDEPHLYEKLTGREFLWLAGRLHGLAPELCRTEVEIWSERLDMRAYLDDLAEGYSHGMRQRVVLASALLHKPRVLIIDEPTVGLDPQNTRRAKDIFRECARAGAAVLLSTHAMDLAAEVGDEVAMLHKGRVLRQGSLDDLRRSDQLEEVFLQLTREAP